MTSYMKNAQVYIYCDWYLYLNREIYAAIQTALNWIINNIVHEAVQDKP